MNIGTTAKIPFLPSSMLKKIFIGKYRFPVTSIYSQFNIDSRETASMGEYQTLHKK